MSAGGGLRLWWWCKIRIPCTYLSIEIRGCGGWKRVWATRRRVLEGDGSSEWGNMVRRERLPVFGRKDGWVCPGDDVVCM